MGDVEEALEFLELITGRCHCHELDAYGCEELEAGCFICGGDY
nr:MAG TPA: hypothetical protein [Caudoviricetes sp.]